jgi:hypothetical protein
MPLQPRPGRGSYLCRRWTWMTRGTVRSIRERIRIIVSWIWRRSWCMGVCGIIGIRRLGCSWRCIVARVVIITISWIRDRSWWWIVCLPLRCWARCWVCRTSKRLLVDSLGRRSLSAVLLRILRPIWGRLRRLSLRHRRRIVSGSVWTVPRDSGLTRRLLGSLVCCRIVRLVARSCVGSVGRLRSILSRLRLRLCPGKVLWVVGSLLRGCWTSGERLVLMLISR